MRKTSLLAGLVLVLMSQFALAAKIAVFSFEQAVFTSEIAKVLEKKLYADSDFAQWVAQEESLRAEIVELNKQKETEGLTWSPEQEGEYRRKINLLQQDRQFNANKIRETRQVWERQVSSLLAKDTEKVLQQIIDSEGYDIVLRKEAAVFSNPAVDITIKVVEGLNKLERKSAEKKK